MYLICNNTERRPYQTGSKTLATPFFRCYANYCAFRVGLVATRKQDKTATSVSIVDKTQHCLVSIVDKTQHCLVLSGLLQKNNVLRFLTRAACELIEQGGNEHGKEKKSK